MRNVRLFLFLLCIVYAVMGYARRPKQIIPDSLMQLTFPFRMDSLTTDTFYMQRVEGGVFLMGATPEQESDPVSTDYPVHTIVLDAFYVATTEVTQALWRIVMPEWRMTDGYFDPDLPISYVSWYDCQLFLERLDSLYKLPFRLPTEAEWEFAARGGNLSKQYRFAGGNQADSVGWGLSNAGFRKHPVALKQPNELGLYDMTGNVSEWCYDYYAPYALGTEPNPRGPDSGQYRIIRGGSFDHCEDNRHISKRQFLSPEEAYGYCGLRLALTLPNEPTRLPEKEQPDLVRKVRIKRHRIKLYYVPSEHPFYIADEYITCSLWRKIMTIPIEGRHNDPAIGMTTQEQALCLDRCRTYSGLPFEFANEQEIQTAIDMQVIQSPKPKKKEKKKRWEQDVHTIQRHRKHAQRVSKWAELVGAEVEIPEDPTLIQYIDHPTKVEQPMRLIIRL